MKNKTKKITLSFKSTKRDEALYNYMMSLDDKSYYIKEALRKVFKDELEAFGNNVVIEERRKYNELREMAALAELEYDRRKGED